MFTSRRYQPVSQQAGDSESDSDETTLFTAENGASQKGEWHFGVRAYDLSQDLDLPRVRLSRPSMKKDLGSRGYSRKQALFGACLFIVIVATVSALAVLFLMKQSTTLAESDTTTTPASTEPGTTTTPASTEPDTTTPASTEPGTTTTPPASTEVAATDELSGDECDKPPKPVVNFVGSDRGPPRPCSTRTTTSPPSSNIELKTEAVPSTTGEPTTSPSEDGEPTTSPSEVGEPTTSPSEDGEPTTSPSEAGEPTTSPSEVGEPTTSPLEDGEPTTSPSEVGEPTTSPSEVGEPTTSPLEDGEPTTSHSEAGEPTTSPSDELTVPPVEETTEPLSLPPVTTPSQDDKLLNNWSDKISETTHETPPTTSISMATTATTTQTHADLTSEPSAAPPFSERGGLDWEQDFFPAMSESNLELFDMNHDGVLDVLMMEDFSQCTARLVAMDGETGGVVWQREVNFPAFAVRCELDVNLDGVMDCLVAGRGGGFAAIDGGRGTLLWEVDPSIVFPLYNFYFPLVVRDLDDDGVNDIINMHGGDVSYKPEEHDRSPAYLVVVSGKTGQSLMPPMLTPDGHESYMSPVLFKLNGKDDFVLFGSGGETVPGSLWAVSIMSIKNQVLLNRASQESQVYQPFANDTYHPCFMKETDFNAIRPTYDLKAYDFQRPIFVSSSNGGMRFCPRWSNINPIWNKYGVCLYELMKTEYKGVMVPPVMVDLDQDGIDDLVVSTFEGHTTAISGYDAATRLWDVHYPNTESYSVPTPLYYNQDSIPDLLIRTNLGVWHEYNVSTLRLLDGSNGAEIWTFDSAHAGMMSSVSISSQSPGSDAMLFVTIGTPDANTDPSMYDDTGVQRRVHRRDDKESADIDNPDKPLDGEAAEMEDEDMDEHNGMDYDYDYMHRAMTNRDPPGLWISTPQDQFPDPKYDLDGFLNYCGESFGRLTAYVWLVTREMIEGGTEIKPIAIHEPFLFTLPEAPPANDTHDMDNVPPEGSDDLPPDGADGQPPPPSVEDGHFTKRHEDSGDAVAPDLKTLRCGHISAPLQIIASPAVGDFNSDGRLDVAYSVVWSSIVSGGRVAPELKVFAFTLEDRYNQMMGAGLQGKKLVTFDTFLSADKQPWGRYMGRYGNNTYHKDNTFS